MIPSMLLEELAQSKYFYYRHNIQGLREGRLGELAPLATRSGNQHSVFNLLSVHKDSKMVACLFAFLESINRIAWSNANAKFSNK